MATFINGRAYSQDELLSNGKYKVLRVGNFYTNDSWYFSDMELDEKYYANDGDLLYTWSATFGPHIWRGGKVIYHYHIWKIELSDILEKRFAVQLLEQDKAKILSDKNGSTMVHITKSGMEQKEVLLPSCVEEQAKIGAYFENLDHLITLHQRKCEETKKLKKYMLQKMFPQNGKRVPEIRFVGFTEDWEQRKLSDITLKIGSGKTPSGGKNAYVDDGIPLIRSQNINNDRVDLEDIVFIDEETDNSMENSRVFTDDVLLNITGASIGRSAVYRGKDKANVNQHVCIIRPTKDFDSDFIQLNLASNFGQKQIDASQAGGGREGLNFQEIGKMSFMFPSNQEQMKIGVYFNHIDYLITLHQRKYEELQKIKKFMLQNMFI